MRAFLAAVMKCMPRHAKAWKFKCTLSQKKLFGTKNLYHELNVLSCCNLTKVNSQTSCYFFGNLNFGERSCENRESKPVIIK